MNATELNIRKFLKTLSVEDIADSVYLFGIDFDNASMKSIMGAINSLYEHVDTLKSIIDRNFESMNGERLPKDSVTQAVIVQDCSRKESALAKILSNQDVYNAFMNYKKLENQEISLEPTR